MKNMDKLMDKFIKYLDNAETFLSDQSPGFIQEMIAYYTWEVQYNFYISMVFFVGSFLLSIILIKLVAVFERKNEGIATFCGFLFVVSMIILVVSAICLPTTYQSIKKLELSPKVFLLEKAVKMVPSND